MHILMDNGGHIVRVNHHNPTPARFFSNELIGPIHPIAVPVNAGIHPQTVQRMNYLNRV